MRREEVSVSVPSRLFGWRKRGETGLDVVLSFLFDALRPFGVFPGDWPLP